VSDKAQLASTCVFFYEHGTDRKAKPPVNTRIQDKNKKIEQLTTHVVRGEQLEAEAMIKKDPGLLLEKWRVKDYSGRTIEGTPLQIALGADDVKFHEDEECMAEMIVRYLMALPDGEERKNAQIREQFPEGWEIVEELKAKKDSEELHNVVQGIEKSKTDEEAEPFIEVFKNYLAQQKERVIKTGKHFNIQLLVEAFKLYEEKYDHLGGFYNRQNNLFWRKVIGTIERYLPACYAQAFCQSIYRIRFSVPCLQIGQSVMSFPVILSIRVTASFFSITFVGLHFNCFRMAGIFFALQEFAKNPKLRIRIKPPGTTCDKKRRINSSGLRFMIFSLLSSA
jgi:hypothetical protein